MHWQLIKRIRQSARLVESLPPDLQRIARDSYSASLKSVFFFAACSAMLAYLVCLPVRPFTLPIITQGHMLLHMSYLCRVHNAYEFCLLIICSSPIKLSNAVLVRLYETTNLRLLNLSYPTRKTTSFTTRAIKDGMGDLRLDHDNCLRTKMAVLWWIRKAKRVAVHLAVIARSDPF